jgi:hypothetical protein
MLRTSSTIVVVSSAHVGVFLTFVFDEGRSVEIGVVVCYLLMLTPPEASFWHSWCDRNCIEGQYWMKLAFDAQVVGAVIRVHGDNLCGRSAKLFGVLDIYLRVLTDDVSS